MTTLKFTLATDWTAANRYTASSDTRTLISNAGEPAVAWTLTYRCGCGGRGGAV